MFTLTAERADGERLTLTELHSAYKVKYTGLDPVGADISTSALGMVDGDKYNSARVGARNIVLTVYVSGNVEQNRIRLYRFFTPKSYIKLHYANGSRKVYAEGRVETCTGDQFSAPYAVQISIICPRPYLSGAETIVKEITSVMHLFEFPFAIEAEGVEFSALDGTGYADAYNAGDVETGAIFHIFAQATVEGATIYNAITNEFFKYSGTLEFGDTLTINTNAGQKRLTVTKSDGTTYNALYGKADRSTWLKLQPGDNYIAYTADSGAAGMLVTVEYNNLFVGV